MQGDHADGGASLLGSGRWRVAASVAAVLAISLAAAPALAGELLRDQTAPSPALGGAIHYTVYLPDGYGAADARYPVVYVLHGFGGGQGEWFHGGHLAEVLDDGIAAGTLQPVIVVAPAAGKSWYVDSAAYGGPGDYESAIVDDLVAAIDGGYATLADRAHRAIAGNSMGGHGALRLAFGHPDLFGAVAALSPGIWKPGGMSWARGPAFDPPEDQDKWFPHTTGEHFDLAVFNAQSPFALVAAVAAAADPPRVFLAAGDDDYWGLNDGTVELYIDLRAHGLTPELRGSAGGHDWKFWRPVAAEALQFFDQGWPAGD